MKIVNELEAILENDECSKANKDDIERLLKSYKEVISNLDELKAEDDRLDDIVQLAHMKLNETEKSDPKYKKYEIDFERKKSNITNIHLSLK